MPKCYYAHCKSIYGTPQEVRDIATLEKLGFDVVNPSSDEIRARLEPWMRHSGRRNAMDFFKGLVQECDVVAFRGLPFSKYIPAGVHLEVMEAVDAEKPIIELPTNLTGRGVSVEATREFLHEVGER